MKCFDDVESPNTRRPGKPGNTDYKPYEVKKEVIREELVRSRIVPFLYAKYPFMFDQPAVLRHPSEIAKVYKNISLQEGEY